MKHKFSLIFLLSFLLSFSLAKNASADQTYIVHMYYNAKTKTLYFDKMKNPVDLDNNQSIGLKEFFDNQETIKSADYILKIQPSNGQEMDVMKFNKKLGPFDLIIPYFVSGKTINIYDFKTGAKIASTDISSFAVCNGNKICEYEKGENADNCISDCANGHVVYSEETRKQLKENNGTLKDPITGQTILENKSYSFGSDNSSFGSSQSEDSRSSSGQSGSSDKTGQSASKIMYAILTIILVVIVAFSAIVYIKKRNQ